MNRLLKYAFIFGTTAFFAVMWGLLIRRHLPEPGAGLRPSYDNLLPPGQDERVERWNIYFGEYRVGEAVLSVRREGDGVLILDSEASLRPGPLGAAMGLPGTLQATFHAVVSPLQGLQSFRAACEEIGGHFTGNVQEDSLSVRGMVAGQRVRTTLPYGPDSFMGNSLSPMASLPRLNRGDVGRTWTMNVLNPLSGQIGEVQVAIVGSRPLELEDRRVQAFRLLFTGSAGRWESWVTDRGRPLMQGTPFGIRMERADLPPQARRTLLDAPAP